MYPDTLFWGINLYDIMLCVGLFAAIVSVRILCDKKKLAAKAFNFFLLTAVGAVAVGFAASTLVQSFYNYVASGVWEWRGMTFLGGLAGGLVCFFLVYFLVGHFVFRDGTHLRLFVDFVCCGVPSVVIAHAFGRIGCLMAGCCYGLPSEKFGLPMWIDGVKELRLPTQLYESIFLFLLYGVLVYLLLKKNNRYIPQIYLIVYGVWRFAIEYLRDDPRGSAFIPFLTPSQLTSILLILAGVALVFAYKYRTGWTVQRLRSLVYILGLTLEFLVAVLFSLKETVLLRDPVRNSLLCGSLARLALVAFLVTLFLFRGQLSALKFTVKDKRAFLFCLLPLAVAVVNFPFSALASGGASVKDLSYIPLFVLLCVTIGGTEELLFRALLHREIKESFARKKNGYLCSVLLSGAIFGIWHLVNLFYGAGFGATALQVGYTFLLGMMFAAVYDRTENVWLCVMLHALFDVGGTLVDQIGSGNPHDLVFWILTIVAGVACAVQIAFYVLKRNQHENLRLKEEKEAEKKFL